MTFPGVFSGIGEFTIHKEFVSAKIAGETASLTDPALDRIFDFAAEVGLVVLLHNDIDMPFPKPGQEPYQVAAAAATCFRRHPKTTIIWAHIGARPRRPPGRRTSSACSSAPSAIPRSSHVYFDISWDEMAKYIVATPETIAGDGGPDQPLPRPVPVRHRRGGADRPGEVPQDLRHLRARSSRSSRPRRGRRCSRATTSGCSTRPGGG